MTTLHTLAAPAPATPAVPFVERFFAAIAALRVGLARRRAAGLSPRLRYDIGETDLNPDKLRGRAASSVSPLQHEMSRMGF